MIITLKKGTFTPNQYKPILGLARQIAALDCVATINFEDGNGETISGQGGAHETLLKNYENLWPKR